MANRFLVNIQADVIHTFHEEPPWLFSESTFPLSSAFCTPVLLTRLNIQTIDRCSHRLQLSDLVYRLGCLDPLAEDSNRSRRIEIEKLFPCDLFLPGQLKPDQIASDSQGRSGLFCQRQRTSQPSV